MERKIITNSQNILDLEETVKVGIQTNLSVMEEENLKLERKIINQKEEHTRLLKEERLKMEEEIRKIKIGTASTNYIQLCYGQNNIKFEGDIKKLHPKVFVNIIRNRVTKTNEVEKLREILREYLTGHALIWFSSKEPEINTFEDFEKQILALYWGTVTQSLVRERLQFGKYDENRNTNRNTYIMQIYSQVQYLEPKIPEEQAVILLYRHFKSQVTETVAIQNMKIMEQFNNYLMLIERSTNPQRYRQNKNFQTMQNTNHTYNRNHNTRRYNNNNYMGRYKNNQNYSQNGYNNNTNQNAYGRSQTEYNQYRQNMDRDQTYMGERNFTNRDTRRVNFQRVERSRSRINERRQSIRINGEDNQNNEQQNANSRNNPPNPDNEINEQNDQISHFL
ncbi:unnamed protein product [Psylliodes chrysocephalus]|uniref:Uncharacterized protein n=1 Tax=Psylliodes chrysocephalus TaxID=3402493 RepID=A0A9P0G9N4_9CUCU|nr:unnamed protein product [Psylliodes chrysocephala]